MGGLRRAGVQNLGTGPSSGKDTERPSWLEAEVGSWGAQRPPMPGRGSLQPPTMPESEPRLPGGGWHSQGSLGTWAACQGLALGWPELQSRAGIIGVLGLRTLPSK